MNPIIPLRRADPFDDDAERRAGRIESQERLDRGGEMTDDERAIRNLVETWMAASKAGDLPTVLSLMADDAVFMVPGQKPFGKAEFVAASERSKNVRVEGSSDIQEIQVVGDWAYLRNYLEVTITPDGGSAVRRSGYTLTILRKMANGRWVLARDANLMTVAA
jgi:uncharacterized protein (TIGR02246 family)